MTSHRATSSADGRAGADGGAGASGSASDGNAPTGNSSSTDSSSFSGSSSFSDNSRGGPVRGSASAQQSHYQLLELASDASAAELRQAFRSLSKRYHPDTTSLPADEARESFARLRQAYAVLADPDSRRAYDAALRRPPLQPPLAPPVPPFPTGPASAPQPIGVRRSLSGGEWFALVLLGLALALSLVLGVGLAWARGTALITRPSWWTEPPPSLSAPAEVTAAPRDVVALAPQQPPQPSGIRQAP
jgi:hypothetical protein